MDDVQSNTQRRKEEARAAMAETRLRSARISSYVDMIPARFYLGFEAPQVKGVYKTSGVGSLDPQTMKRTSQLVEEAAAVEQVERPSGDSASSKERRKKKESNGNTDGQVSTSNSRSELRSKLEQRIAELKEERRRKQSETDSARVAKAKDSQVGKSKPAPADVQDDFEAGRLDFDLKKSELPFEAGVNKRGNKIQKLRANLRAEENSTKRVAEAEAKGEDADAVRKELEMGKALKRAQGLPVHDDISRLRKSQKMLDRKKRVGKDRWEKREAAEKENAEWKQQKRKNNLRDQRQGKAKKKGKGRVGFEGAKSGYMNSDK